MFVPPNFFFDPFLPEILICHDGGKIVSVGEFPHKRQEGLNDGGHRIPMILWNLSGLEIPPDFCPAYSKSSLYLLIESP